MPEPINSETLLDLYERMFTISRQFEERAIAEFKAGTLPGFIHASVGQEAIPVGVCAHLTTDDAITSTHRGHGHLIAKGGDVRGMFAELYGKETGLCRGRGGSMHIIGIALSGSSGLTESSAGASRSPLGPLSPSSCKVRTTSSSPSSATERSTSARFMRL